MDIKLVRPVCIAKTIGFLVLLISIPAFSESPIWSLPPDLGSPEDPYFMSRDPDVPENAAVIPVSVANAILPGASASAPPPVRMEACFGCSETQMRTQALAGLGVRYIYNVQSGAIYRYHVHPESSCGIALSPLDVPSAAQSVSAKEDAPAACGSYRVADQLDVEPAVLQIFDLQRSAYLQMPSLFTAKAGDVPMPIDAYTGRTFDPRDIAWEFPQGTYYRFQNWFASFIASDALIRASNVALADYLRGWRLSFGPIVIGYPSGLATTLEWASNNVNIDVSVCNQQGDCSIVNVRKTNQNIVFSFTGSYDRTGSRYPQPDNQTPSPRWRWQRAGGDGPAFAQSLRNFGVIVPGGNGTSWCQSAILTCARYESGMLIGCRIDCN